MPYSGPNDDKLPSNVKKLSSKKRSQWVSVWNSTYEKCTDEGGDDCEGLAFRTANGVVKSELFTIAIDGELDDLFSEGGPGSGNHGHKSPKGQGPGGSLGGTGGGLSKKVRLSRHAHQRMRERKKFQSVKSTLAALQGKSMPNKDWYVSMSRKGRVDGFLVGVDGIVKTVLGSWGKPRGVAVSLESAPFREGVADTISLTRSIAWQFANMTRAIAEKYCEITGIDMLTPTKLALWFEDYDWPGLEGLLMARSEVLDPAPSGERRARPSQEVNRMEKQKVDELAEAVFGTQSWKARIVAKSFMSTYGGVNSDGYYEGPRVADIFFNDEKFGDAVIGYDYKSGEMYAYPFELVSLTECQFKDDKKKEVALVYEYLDVLAPGATVGVEIDDVEQEAVEQVEASEPEIEEADDPVEQVEASDPPVEQVEVNSPEVVETDDPAQQVEVNSPEDVETEASGDHAEETEPEAVETDDPVKEVDPIVPTPEKLNEADTITVLEAAIDPNVDKRDPITIRARLIKAGPGNSRDMHYYPGDMLRRDAKIFEGTEMWITDHDEAERTEATKVSVIDKIVSFENDGSPIAEITVFDPDFAEKVRNRAKADRLGTLKCSILATGFAEKSEIDDVEYNVVTSLDEALAVDWVSRPGAGGQATAVVSEADQLEPDPEPEPVEETSNAIPVVISEDEQPESAPIVERAFLTPEQIAAVLEESNLPPLAKSKLATVTFSDEDALTYAIAAERQYLKALTGAGTPVAEGKLAKSYHPPNSFFGNIPITETDDEWWDNVRQSIMHLPA